MHPLYVKRVLRTGYISINVNLFTKGDGRINLANAMSGVFAYISATMAWILQRKVSN